MIKRLLIGSMMAALLFGSGCAYTKIRLPLSREFNNTDIGTKEGRSHVTSVLYLFSWGDGGAKAAAVNGNLKVIKYADAEVFSVLFGAYSRVTTILYGD